MLEVKQVNRTLFFFKMVFGFFLSYVLARLMEQTDIIMVGFFGEKAMAAFSIPQNMMFIDSFVALLVTPFITLYLSRSRSQKKVRDIFCFVVILSFALTVLGLVVYPLLYTGYRIESSVKNLGGQFLFLMTISIFPRFVLFGEELILWSRGKIKRVLVNNIILFLVNIPLNWICMFWLSMGAIGNYVSTVILYTLGALDLFVVLGKPSLFPLKERLKRIMLWLRHYQFSWGWEFFRTLSEKVLPLVMLWVITVFFQKSWILALYAIVMGWKALFSMFPVAILRATPIVLNSSYRKNESSTQEDLSPFLFLRSALVWSVVGVGVFGIISFLGREWLFQVYHLVEQDLQKGFSLFLLFWIFLFALMTFNAFWIGIVYFEENLRHFAIVDIVGDWIFFLPLFVLGAWQNSVLFLWGAFCMKEIWLGFSLPFGHRAKP